MAVKITRQTNKIVLLGAPASAAALSTGQELSPAALRAAGLAAELESIGYQVKDLGDDPAQLYKPDEESPRARNLPAVIASLDALKPRVEQAVKSGALPLILSGDGSIAIATIAGARRYYKHVSVIYMSRTGGLLTPATTSTGSVEGMIVSHLTGRGAAELVRFWGEPPLVREPDLALFGVERLDPSEAKVLDQSPLRRYLADDVQRGGAATVAKTALDRVRGTGNPFILHFHVSVIPGFEATDNPGSGGLCIEELREALEVFATQDHLAAIEVVGYNPSKDPGGSGAKQIVRLIADALRARFEAFQAAAQAGGVSADSLQKAGSSGAAPSTERTVDSATEVRAAISVPSESVTAALTAVGEAWSSESLEESPEEAGEHAEASQDNPSDDSSETDEPNF